MDLAIKEVAAGHKVTSILSYAGDIGQLATLKVDLQHYMTKRDNAFEHFGNSGNKQITSSGQHCPKR